ncbi:hypothetical protein KVT40_006735 [Elsinoe batatas]|uniref:Uncharacterized protein n=1 Tax=Elsinoe batatas TaxID=2601811 RepID=A0A8K0KY96_9PEZI|nr:hypothetical protein KVT40_006735 [Elsinoe batatas]
MSLIMDPVPPFSHSTSSTHIHPQQQHSYLADTSPQQPHTGFHPVNRGIQKREDSRNRSTSGATAVKLEGLLPDSIRNDLTLSPGSRQHNPNWSSPKSSPRPHPFLSSSQSTTGSPAWTPIPSRSDSGVVSSQAHAAVSHLGSVGSHQPGLPSSAPMSSVNYGMPAQYGPLGIDESSLHGSSRFMTGDVSGCLPDLSDYQFDPAYRQPMQQQQPPVSQGYDFSQADTYGTSSMRTSSPMPVQQSYGDEYRLATTHDVHRNYTADSLPRPLPSSTLASNASSYTSSGYQRSPSMYDGSVYGHSIPGAQHMAGQIPTSMGYGQPVYSSSSMASMPRSMSSVSNDSMRGVNSTKPKPQCWEHGCNGRKFSTFSNLLRHQREKSGTASKSYCPKCGAEFTRTTARNGHLAHDKCSKQRKGSSEGS